MSCTREINYAIYDDKTGERITVGSNGDGLAELIDVTYFDAHEQKVALFTLTQEQATCLADTLLLAVKDRLKER